MLSRGASDCELHGGCLQSSDCTAARTQQDETDKVLLSSAKARKRVIDYGFAFQKVLDVATFGFATTVPAWLASVLPAASNRDAGRAVAAVPQKLPTDVSRASASRPSQSAGWVLVTPGV